MAAQIVALCLVRKWWRPIICLGLGASLVTNGIAMPLIYGEGADLVGLAALVGSVTLSTPPSEVIDRERPSRSLHRCDSFLAPAY